MDLLHSPPPRDSAILEPICARLLGPFKLPEDSAVQPGLGTLLQASASQSGAGDPPHQRHWAPVRNANSPAVLLQPMGSAPCGAGIQHALISTVLWQILMLAHSGFRAPTIRFGVP